MATINQTGLEAWDDQGLACPVDTFADRAQTPDARAAEVSWTATAILSQVPEVLTASVSAGADTLAPARPPRHQL
jgi:hypothetical protein